MSRHRCRIEASFVGVEREVEHKSARRHFGLGTLVANDRDLARERLVADGARRHLVRAGHEKAPIVAVLARRHVVCDAGHANHCIGDTTGVIAGGQHEALDARVHLFHVVEERAAIVAPLVGQLGGARILAARELDRDLHAVRVHVVEVLHAAGHVVPLGAIGDAVLELVAGGATRCGARAHGGVCARVHARQVAEGGVVGRGAVGARLLVLGRVVEWIGGDERAAVEVGREHELVGEYPLDERGRLGLSIGDEQLEIGRSRRRRRRRRGELIGKVAIEVDRVGVLAARRLRALALVDVLEAVRVGRRHDVDVGGVDEARDALVAAVLAQQLIDEADEELAADRLVAVHVRHVLELGPTGLVRLAARHQRAADAHDEQLAALDRLADGEEARYARKGLLELGEQRVQCLVVVVLREQELFDRLCVV